MFMQCCIGLTNVSEIRGFETVLKPGVSILPNLLKAMKLGEGAKSPVALQISKRTCMKKYIKFSGRFQC